MALAYSTVIRNAMLDSITTAVGSGGGLIRIYDGTRPSSGGTSTTLLAQLTCSTTLAPASSSGVLTLNAITQDSSADASGTATWFRLTTSSGVFCIDGSVSTAASDLNLTTNVIVSTQPVSITSFVITEGNP